VFPICDAVDSSAKVNLPRELVQFHWRSIGIRLRWDAGYTDTVKVLAQAPWAGEFDPLEGFILHEAEAGRMRFEG
jgi:hypothetical protein